MGLPGEAERSRRVPAKWQGTFVFHRAAEEDKGWQVRNSYIPYEEQWQDAVWEVNSLRRTESFREEKAEPNPKGTVLSRGVGLSLGLALWHRMSNGHLECVRTKATLVPQRLFYFKFYSPGSLASEWLCSLQDGL